MKLLFLIIALSAGAEFSQLGSSSQTATCDVCPLPDATPEPTPIDAPWQCYYVIVDGVKREVCE